jgi:hypothetical protein
MLVCTRRGSLAPTIVSLDQRARSIWKLSIERFPVFDATSQELRPGWHGDIFWNWFRQQAPELWVEPTQIVPAAVAVGSNAIPQPHHFGNEFLSTPA